MKKPIVYIDPPRQPGSLYVRISPAMYAAIWKRATDTNTTITLVVENALRKYLNFPYIVVDAPPQSSDIDPNPVADNDDYVDRALRRELRNELLDRKEPK